MILRDRIGFDAGEHRLEDAIGWAAKQKIHFVDFNADRGPNHIETWTPSRVAEIRRICSDNAIRLGVHTLSSVNVAEFSPYVDRGVDEYLKANLDLAASLECGWAIVHAGYHFGTALDDRIETAIRRLERLATGISNAGVRLLLENLNLEPERAEVHYLAHNVSELRHFFDAIPAERLGWAFTVNHANLVPEGIDGFLDAFGIERIGEVRLADNTGKYEIHLPLGSGHIDFRHLIQRLEQAGYCQHYSMAFGSPAEKLIARDLLVSFDSNNRF